MARKKIPAVTRADEFPPDPCWIIRDPLESRSLRLHEGLLVFSSPELADEYRARALPDDIFAPTRLRWNDLARRASETYPTVVIDYREGAPLRVVPLVEVEGWPSEAKAEKTWPPGAPLLAEVGNIELPAVTRWRARQWFPVKLKPPGARLNGDRGDRHNYEWSRRLPKRHGGYLCELSGTFGGYFMWKQGQVEENVPAATLRRLELTRPSKPEAIAKFLRRAAPVPLCRAAQVARMHSEGHQDAVLKPGALFFVRSQVSQHGDPNELVVVRLYVRDEDEGPRYCFDQFVLANVSEWRGGTQVYAA